MSEKSPLLELAESYYIVSNDLRNRAMRMNETADQLERMANRMCEQNMSAKDQPVEKQP